MKRRIHIPSTLGVGKVRKGQEASEVDGWRKIAAREDELVAQIAMLQNTIRLAKLVPLWEVFVETEYWWEVRKLLDQRQAWKFRNWWELLYDCGDFAFPESKRRAGFCRAVLLAERLRREQGADVAASPAQFRLTPEQAGPLREAVLRRYEHLTLK